MASSSAASEEWRHCAQWLIRCGVLAPEHRSTQGDAVVFELAQHLRDGVILCHLASKLAPGSVENREVSQRPQMSQFLCIQNIRIFLRVLVSTFRIPKDALFEPLQLFNLTDFGRVISCLSLLSKTAIALDATTGFPPDSFSASSKDEDEEIYMPLEHLANENEIDDEEMEDVYECVTELEEEEEEIYDRILKKVDSCEGDLPVPKTKRDHCLKELLETEKNYVDALDMINKNFVQPLKTSITREDKEKIFINVEDLKHFHSNFYAELRKLYPKDVSEVFIKYKTSFLAYGKYCSLLTESQEHMELIKRRSETIRLKFEECEKAAKDGRFRLRDILSVPMQRILKYPLLLRELVKNSADQEDRVKERLDNCLEAMQDVALFINEVKRDNETMITIGQIQKSIVDINMPPNTSLTDYGKLQRDGQVSIKAHDDRMSRQRHIFLFDKVLLVCKAKGDDFRYKDALDLSKYRVEDRERGGDKWSHQFVLSEISNNHAYTFYAKTKEAKRKWIEAIKLALDNTSPSGSRTATHEFSLHTFKEPTYCNICQKLLHGIFFQGYRCERTQTNAHKGCITKASEPKRSNWSNGTPFVNGVNGVNGVGSPRGVFPALQSYNGHPSPGPDHPTISFNADAHILVTDNSDSFWWKGCRVDAPDVQGYFPMSYVVASGGGGGVVTRSVSAVDFSRGPPPINRRSMPKIRSGVNSAPSGVGSGTFDSTIVDSGADSVIDVNRNSFGAGGGTTASSYIQVGGFPPQRDSNHQHNNNNSQRLPQATGGRRSPMMPERNLTSYPWYVANMSRSEAETTLRHTADGTFMIRRNNDNHALSIAFGGSVKHIRVKKEETGYFIADIKFFDSIPSLVDFYATVSLVASFPGLDTSLVTPIDGGNNGGDNNGGDTDDGGGGGGSCGGGGGGSNDRDSGARDTPPPRAPPAALPVLSYAVAIYDFAPTALNHIGLREGDRVAIVSKAGGDRGWWKGQVIAAAKSGSKKIGYFPMNYVKEEID